MVGRERDAFVGGVGATGHWGAGGRVHAPNETLGTTTVLMPLGLDVMLRVQGTNRFASFGYGGGYYMTGDLGKSSTGFGRVLGLVECNAGAAFLCGGGARGELGFGVALEEQTHTNPGLFVEDTWRTRTLVTFALFGEYTGYFTRRTELPMVGVEIGYAYEDDLLDIARGRVLR